MRSSLPWVPNVSRPHFVRELRVCLRIVAAFTWRQSDLEPEGTGCDTCRCPVAIHGFELPDAHALSFWQTGRWPYLVGAGANRDAVSWVCFPNWQAAEKWAYAARPKVPWPPERRFTA